MGYETDTELFVNQSYFIYRSILRIGFLPIIPIIIIVGPENGSWMNEFEWHAKNYHT